MKYVVTNPNDIDFMKIKSTNDIVVVDFEKYIKNYCNDFWTKIFLNELKKEN